MKVSVGFHPNEETNSKDLDFLSQYKNDISDLHFAHWNPAVLSSGRGGKGFICSEKAISSFLDEAQKRDMKPCLLMNSLIDLSYWGLLMKDMPPVSEERFLQAYDAFKFYYSRGVRKIVLYPISFAAKLKNEFPDIEIHSSTFNDAYTVEDLQKEKDAGIDVHTGNIYLCRDYEQLQKNYDAGFKQKIFSSVCCIKTCGAMKYKYTHERPELVRTYRHNCVDSVASDFRNFLVAGWITVKRLKTYLQTLDVDVKIHRFVSSDINKYKHVKLFFDAYYDDKDYNVLDFISTILKRFPYPPQYKKEIMASWFDDSFFEAIKKCGCDDFKCHTGCSVCKPILEKVMR